MKHPSHENKPVFMTEEMTFQEYSDLIKEECRKVPFNPSELWSAGNDANVAFSPIPLFIS
jgi:hypothetical protein